METDPTIERIKNLEGYGKREIEKTELKKAQIIEKAKEKSLLLIQEFEKTKDTSLKDRMAAVSEEIKKETAKMISKSQKDAEEIRKKAAERTSEVSRKFFEIFRKKMLL